MIRRSRIDAQRPRGALRTTFKAALLPGALLTAASLALPASAAETVIGTSQAERCFNSAVATSSPHTAADACTDAIRDEPLGRRDLAATYVNRGILFSRRGRHEDAYADFTEALEMEPALVHALINRGNTLLRMKRFDEALADYESAVFYSEGRDPLVFFNRSLAYEQLGRKASAREDLVRAVQLDPESRAYREALASLE